VILRTRGAECYHSSASATSKRASEWISGGRKKDYVTSPGFVLKYLLRGSFTYSLALHAFILTCASCFHTRWRFVLSYSLALHAFILTCASCFHTRWRFVLVCSFTLRAYVPNPHWFPFEFSPSIDKLFLTLIFLLLFIRGHQRSFAVPCLLRSRAFNRQNFSS
jgi:hypothetical protein